MNEDFITALRNIRTIANDVIRSGEYSDQSVWALLNAIDEAERKYTNENKCDAG